MPESSMGTAWYSTGEDTLVLCLMGSLTAYACERRLEHTVMLPQAMVNLL